VSDRLSRFLASGAKSARACQQLTVFVPRYRDRRGGGCMKAQDVGGAIIGKHIDVYRRAPDHPDGSSAYRDEAIYFVPPGESPGRKAPKCLR